MMKLSKQMTQKLQEEFDKNPLGDKEIRKIPDMGNLFVSRHRLVTDGEEEVEINGTVYWFVYAMRISGTVYYFHGGDRVTKTS